MGFSHGHASFAQTHTGRAAKTSVNPRASELRIDTMIEIRNQFAKEVKVKSGVLKKLGDVPLNERSNMLDTQTKNLQPT